MKTIAKLRTAGAIMQRFGLPILWGMIALCFGTVAEAKAIGQKKIVGVAHVLDGDSLRIGAYEIRLFGVDAFEMHQMCGRMACGSAARNLMRSLAEGKVVHCVVRDRDKYARFVAICATPKGQDMGAILVRSGLGVAYRTYSHDYLDEERAAKAAKAGAWGYGFQSPLNYRKTH
jgi:endonuclease YncB( thermonuclease family)